MRILTIPDLHGKNIWKEAAKDIDKYDKIIFLGDYFDSFTHKNVEIIDNIKDIIKFKLKYPEKVELLLGNHDICYLFDDAPLCSGHRRDVKMIAKADFLDDNKELFKVGYQYKNYLWTHAGISNKWMIHNERHLEDWSDKCSNLGDILNSLLETSRGRDVLFSVGEIRGGLRHDTGGPLWADITETNEDFLKCGEDKLHQIIGHSKVHSIITHEKEHGSITFCDCLDKKIDYYIVEI